MDAREKPVATYNRLMQPTSLGPAEPLHPQVLKAIAYIESHLADCDLKVGQVARTLDLNNTYLSHLFSENVGVRMGRYIARRRVQVAQKLLATTDWQVKRVAFESGHASPDWFTRVFHNYAGMTPVEYRLQKREPKS